MITCVYPQERHHFCHFLLLFQTDRIWTKTYFKRKKKRKEIKKEEGRFLGERASLGWASLLSRAGRGRPAPPPPPPRQMRPSIPGPWGSMTPARRPIHSAHLGSQARLPSRDHPWTLLLSLSPDFCYAKFQQGDLEKNDAGSQAAIRLFCGDLGTQASAHCAGRADPVACAPPGQLFPH